MPEDGRSTKITTGHFLSKRMGDIISETEEQSPPSGVSRGTQTESDGGAPQDPSEPCVACGWTLEKNANANYRSNVKLFYAASTGGAWALGSRFILKERLVFPSSYEGTNLRFLKEKTNLSVPNILHEWTESSRYFSITSRIEGETLEQVWPSLSGDDKERIAGQVARHLEKMRALTSDRIEAVGGEPLYDTGLFPNGEIGQQPLSSDEELWNELEKPLSRLDDETRETLRENMPPCRPYTFTHGDLSSYNIMVKDRNFSGFLDFEHSGFFPVWYEYVCCRFGLGEADTEWKELLSRHITEYPKAMNFHMARLNLERDPNGEEAQKYLNDLVEDSSECPMVQIW
ncbi:kinase-like protein [Hypoxylon sp. FL0543]|nr:kinase-like protein [Hypoxylon sp. FL0543]